MLLVEPEWVKKAVFQTFGVCALITYCCLVSQRVQTKRQAAIVIVLSPWLQAPVPLAEDTSGDLKDQDLFLLPFLFCKQNMKTLNTMNDKEPNLQKPLHIQGKLENHYACPRAKAKRRPKSLPSNITYSLLTHGTFSRIDHVFSHQLSLNRFRKIDIIQRTSTIRG